MSPAFRFVSRVLSMLLLAPAMAGVPSMSTTRGS